MAYAKCKIWSFGEEIDDEKKRYKAMREGYVYCAVKALIDTTSNFNIISKSLVDKLDMKYNTKLDNYQKKLRDVVGYVTCLDLSFQDRLVSGSDEVLNNFMVVKNPKADLILGLPWIWLRETIIDVRNEKFSIYGEFIPLCNLANIES